MGLFIIVVAVMAWRWPVAALVLDGAALEYLVCEWRERCPTTVQ